MMVHPDPSLSEGRTRMKMDYKLINEISVNECAVCFGTYEDDIDDITGHVTTEWIQCTNEKCAVWCHADCLDTSDGDYVCTICQAIFG